MSQHHDSGAAIAAKASPVVGYAGAYFGGLSLPDWAALLAIIYTLCLLAQQAHRFYCWANEKLERYRASDQ